MGLAFRGADAGSCANAALPAGRMSSTEEINLMSQTRTLIVIADGAHARFFLHDGPGKGLEPLNAEEMEGDTPAGRDIMSDAPGRSFSSHGPGRSAMEPPTDPRDQVESEFRGSVADNIERLMKKKNAERLIVAADPRSLGELRKTLPDRLHDKITATLDKDLTNIPDNDLPKHFEDVLAV